MNQTFSESLVAPCGINCGVCLGFLRQKNKCEGCWGNNLQKPKHCLVCRIKNCGQLAKTESRFCYHCHDFPCLRLKQFDKRYRTKYSMSILENLRIIKEWGVDEFLRLEHIKWKCPGCGGAICVHTGCCMECEKK